MADRNKKDTLQQVEVDIILATSEENCLKIMNLLRSKHKMSSEVVKVSRDNMSQVMEIVRHVSLKCGSKIL